MKEVYYLRRQLLFSFNQNTTCIIRFVAYLTAENTSTKPIDDVSCISKSKRGSIGGVPGGATSKFLFNAACKS